MQRVTVRSGLVVAVAASLTLAACGSKADTPAPGGAGTTSKSSAPLKIKPDIQIDKEGKAVQAATGGTPADPAGDGKAKCSGVAIAMAGALTGPNAALGINILNGAKVAVDKHNKANAGCQVKLQQFDTEGDPQKATQVAPQIINDKTVIGLLGPAFSGETKATGVAFHQAGLLSLTASATNPALTTNGWTNFYRGLANDAVQGPAVAHWMVNTAGYKKICLVQDNSDYGVGLAKEIAGGLGSAAKAGCAASVKTKDTDFASAVSAIKSGGGDAVFYAGYYAEAAPFVTQLREAGVTIPFVSADGVNDPQFVSQAGDSSKDAILSCPCGPAPETFAKDYKALNNADPGTYSVEGYDLATIMLKAIDSGVTDRAKMVDYVKAYDADGLARHYKWNDKGELSSSLIWIYKVG